MRKHEKKVWKGIRYLCTFLLLCCSTMVFAQQSISVSGTIVDNQSDPLPGVSVNVKGSSSGDISDANGKYSITVSSRDAVLVFSYLGFVTQEITVGNRTSINVAMVEDVKQIAEVIVIGFGTATPETLTGSVSAVSAKQLESRPVANTMQALQGLIPGLNIDVTSGNMTSTPSFNVRGPGSVGTSPSDNSTSLVNPLVLIDGMEGDVNNVNPNDIESVSVLKDAAASSIYGSKAAFGVILVTTKRGKAGSKVNVNYNYNLRLSSPIRMPEMMDSWTYMQFFNDAARNGGASAPFGETVLSNALKWQKGEIQANNTYGSNGRWDEGFVSGWDNQDYFKVVYRDMSTAQEHNVSANGGVGSITYYTSFNYIQRDGFVKWQQDHNQRYSTNVRLSYDVNKWVRINYNNRFSRDKIERPNYYDGDNAFFQDLARQAWPNFPLYDENGNLWGWPALRLRDGGTAWTENDQTVQQLQAVIEPIKNWKTYIQYNYSTSTNTRKRYSAPAYILYDKDNNPYMNTTGSGSTGQVRDDWEKTNLMDFNAYSEYSRQFAEVHNFKVMAGMQSQEGHIRRDDLRRYGVQVPDLPVIDLTNGLATPTATTATTPEISGAQDKYATMGFFGRINYDFKNKYLLEVNLRYDGTSRFRAGSRWTFSPSAAIAWNLAQEEFLKPYDRIVNLLKLRASYGVLSNQNTRSYYPTYQNMTLGAANSNWLLNGTSVNTAWGPI